MIRPPTPPATHLKVVASSEQHKKAKGPPGSIVFRPLLLPLMAQEAPVFDPTMSEQKPTLQQPGSCTQKIPDVYKCLGIADPSISDGDVVVAFHKAYSVQRDSPGGDVSETVNALNAIAGSRGSQWLAFTRMILPHLTEANVSVLSSRRMSTPNFQSSVDVNNQQSGNASTVHETKDPTTAISCEPFIFRAAADPPPPTEFTLSAKPTWPKATKSPRASRAHDFDSDGSIDWAVSVTASNYSEDLSSGASSSDRDSVLSQLSEIEGGKLWNGQYWCCAVCNEELDDEGKCFEDHTTDPCGYCGKDFEMRDCSKYCVECHLELPEPCPHCNADEEGEEAPMEMIWDDTDGIWRCTTCMWEVEASREDEGHCQCFVDPEVLPHLLIAPHIDELKSCRKV